MEIVVDKHKIVQRQIYPSTGRSSGSTSRYIRPKTVPVPSSRPAPGYTLSNAQSELGFCRTGVTSGFRACEDMGICIIFQLYKVRGDSFGSLRR